MDIKKLLNIVLASLEDGKAVDVDLYDVKKLTSMSDYILIASGNSRRQVSALADKLIQSVKENKFKTKLFPVDAKYSLLGNLFAKAEIYILA